MKKRLLLLFFVSVFSLGGCDGGTKEELYAKGLAEIAKENPYGGVVFLKNALERDPQYYDARYELAKAFRSVGKNELAEDEFVQLLQQDPTRDLLRLELARIYIVNRKPDLAIKETSEYVRRQGVNAETYELIGIASFLKSLPAEAEQNFLLALAVDPTRTQVKLELATVYVQFRIKEKEGDARRLIAELLLANPKDTGAYYLLADLESLAGNKEKTQAHYQTISDLDPADYQALYKVGVAQAGYGNLVAATKVAQTLLQKFPKRCEGTRLTGIVHYHQNYFGDAITNLLRSAQINSAAETTFYLGLSYYRNGDLGSAISQFYQLTDKSAYSEPARLLVGIILLKQLRIDDAMAETKKLLVIQPENALAHNILGSALMAKGRYEEGIKEFNRAIELDPGIVDAHLKKGVFHLQEGRLSDAESDFSAAVQAAPNLLDTRQLLACFYLRESQPERAIAILQEGLCGEKDDAALYDNLASVFFSQNKRPEGLSSLQKARKADPDYLSAIAHLGTYYLVVGEPEQALKEYRLLLGKDPHNLPAWLSVAAILELSNRDAEALEAYQSAIKGNEGSAYLALADYFLRKSRRAEAVATLDEAIQVIPRNLDARQLKYRLYMEEKEFKKASLLADEIELINPQLGLRRIIETALAMKDAIKALEKADRYVTLHPGSAFGYMMQALIHEQENEYPQAVAAMEAGIHADRNNIEAMVQLGDLHARKREYKAAQTVYGEALRKDANAVAVIFAQGALLEDLGEKPEAIKKYLAVLEKDANHFAALNNLAYLYIYGYGRPEEGLRLAFLAFRQQPGNPMVMDTLGMALLKNGRSQAAITVLEKAVALIPELPTLTYHLALAYRDSGQKAQALKALQTIAARKDFPEAEAAGDLAGKLSSVKEGNL